MATKSAAKEVRPTGAMPPKGQPARILIVDDDERNLLALSEVLSDVAEVVTATSGQNALRRLLKGDFAVILLDVFMPGLDGYETASLIRARDQTSRIPIIFLSAVNKETEHLMRGYAMGAVDYVFKPVDPLVLKSKVGVFVDLYEMRRQVEDKSRAEQELRDANFRAELGRLQVERELQESRKRQAAIIQSLPIVLYTEAAGNAPRRPDFVSGDLQALTGFSFEEVHGKTPVWAERLHPDDRDRVLRALDDRERDERFSIEYRWQCADGSYKFFHDQAVLVKDEGGEAEFAGTLIDITDRKSLESRLVQAGKMDAIGQLTGGIAHDFNNLLAAVLGGLHVIERRLEMGDREKQVVGQMRHAAEQGAELVRRMMAFARKQDLTPTSIDPAVLCQSVAGLIEHALGGRVEVEWHCPTTDLNLFVDRSQLELTLVNLILNARDAMPDGGKIDVSIEECGGDGDSAETRLRICVRDEGNGIPPELIEKITEPFFTTKEAGKGTGLGLSMAAGFVQQSGGELRIESEVGKGSTVEVILPATAAEHAHSAPSRPASEKPSLKGKRMLLIDDDESVRLVLREQLRDLDMIVDDYASGANALEAVRGGEASYDFVLSDFAMPGMNGLETIRALGGLLPSARAVLMTGYADESVTRGAKTSIPIVHKPLDLQKICDALQG